MESLNIAFDIDDTLYKIVGSGDEQIQVPDHKLILVLKWFYENGHHIYVWSGGGPDYAQMVARKIGIGDIVSAIPKSEGSNMDIVFDDKDVSLGKVNVLVKRVLPLNACHICAAPFLPDESSTIFGTDSWDRHTFKPSCEHYSTNVRISIG